MFPKHNQVSKEDTDFYISFNFGDSDCYGDVTTALVIGQMQRFYILNGDHREQYSKCESFKDCVEYFLSNSDKVNKLSNKYDELDAHGIIQYYKGFREGLSRA